MFPRSRTSRPGDTRHEAIAGYLEAAAKEGLPVPQGDRGDIVEVEIPAP
jgi:hypothetical protein